MNEQVEQKANELLLSLIDKAQAGMEFASGQIPDVVNQLLMWHFAQSLIYSLIGLLLLFVSPLPAFYIFRRKEVEGKVVYGPGWSSGGRVDLDAVGFTVVLTAITWTPGLGIVLLNDDWLKIWLAPKLYLLEYAASLVK